GVEPCEGLEQVAAVAGPAACSEGTAPNVETDRDPVPPRGDRMGAPLRVLQRGGPDVDPGAARRHRRVERVVVADTAAHLDLDVDVADDRGQEGTVVAVPEGRVEVDQMDPLGAGVLPAHGRFEGITE